MSDQHNATLSQELAKLAVVKIQDVLVARFVGREEAAKLGFPPAVLTRIATAISEITRNVVQHAGAPGQVSFLLEQTPERRGLRIVVEDHGRGIEPNERGKSDASLGLGAGIPGTQRLMDEFEIDSRPGGGTRISMVKWLPPADGGIADHT